MDFLLIIILGAIAGFVASYVMESPHGPLTNVVLGIIGALVGGFFMNLFGQTGTTGFNLYSLLVAVLGAIIVIALARVFRGKQVA